jgi:hypothetical protein
MIPCSNTQGATFGPFSSIGSVAAVLLFDGSPVGSSNLLAFNTLAAGSVYTFGIGDYFIYQPGALTVVLS